MARYFRFYGKKRGDRRTGSGELGGAGIACFSLVCFLGGCIWLAINFATCTLPELRVNRDFVEHTCTVVDKRLDHRRNGDMTYGPAFHVRYSIGDRNYSIWAPYHITDVDSPDLSRGRAILDRYVIGGQTTCWYDPAKPQRVVLARGYTWYAGLMLLVPGTFIAIGAGGLFYGVWGWGRSAERRALLAQAGRRPSFDEAGKSPDRFPYVPRDSELTDSPGTTLAFRLPAGDPGWPLLVLLIATMVWNSLVAVLIVMVVRGHLQDRPDWLFTMFVSLFAMVGVGLAVSLARQLLARAGVGPTIVETSQHPLYPGESYELFVSQAGRRLRLDRLVVLLVCDEEAVYRQGTDTRTATSRVVEHQVYHQDNFVIRQGAPWEAHCRVEIPSRAMHSFRAGHNSVNWKVIVEGRVEGRPGFERGFPVHVYPCRDGHDRT